MEQALAWIMWRDDARVSETGDGRVSTIVPRDTGKIPELGEIDIDEIVSRLLEIGLIEKQWPDTAMEPYPGRERLVALHERSGCVAVIDVRRKRMGGLPCLLSDLRWWPPMEVPHLSLKQAIEALHCQLVEGKITTIAEIDGDPHPVRPEQWEYRAIALSSDENIGTALVINGKRAIRLRLDRNAILKLWPRPTNSREVTGAAEGKNYREIVVDKTARGMLDRASRKLSTTDDDIKCTLRQFCTEFDRKSGPHDRTINRWVSKVRERMNQQRTH